VIFHLCCLDFWFLVLFLGCEVFDFVVWLMRGFIFDVGCGG